jgi:hypothetical protein
MAQLACVRAHREPLAVAATEEVVVEAVAVTMTTLTLVTVVVAHVEDLLEAPLTALVDPDP